MRLDISVYVCTRSTTPVMGSYPPTKYRTYRTSTRRFSSTGRDRTSRGEEYPLYLKYSNQLGIRGLYFLRVRTDRALEQKAESSSRSRRSLPTTGEVYQLDKDLIQIRISLQSTTREEEQDKSCTGSHKFSKLLI